MHTVYDLLYLGMGKYQLVTDRRTYTVVPIAVNEP